MSIKTVDDEWLRVLQNPDNMLVSDSIKAAITGLIAEDSVATTKDIHLIATLVSNTDSYIDVPFELMRMEQSKNGWMCMGNCKSDIIHTLIRSKSADWQCLIVNMDNENIREIHITSTDDLHIAIDFPGITLSECVVTLTCVGKNDKSRVL